MLIERLKTLTTIALLLAVIVVMLGAYTRLTDAGLGCPDWPGCYGQMVLTKTTENLTKAQRAFPEIPIETAKAWTEMTHRYAAGTLGFLIFCIAFMTYHLQKRHRASISKLPFLLVGLVFFQAALGMWTVTLKLLPIVVMGHLLGGMLIFAGLTYFRWQLTAMNSSQSLHANSQQKILLNWAIVIVFIQIALGGWVSANYAGIACIGFPTCNGQWLPTLDWKSAFHLFSSLTQNYQGGVLDNSARVTIQMIHRLGAVVTATYLLIVCSLIIRKTCTKCLKQVAWLTILTVLLQFSLGIINVVYLLPLGIAVAHNGVAACLFALVLSLRYLVSSEGAYHVSAC